jgi:arsenate reductase
MSHFVIWHNPRCSKSRQSLAILEEHNIEPEIKLYLETPPTRAELEKVLGLLKLKPIEITRTGEGIFKMLKLSKSDPDNRILEVLVSHPKLIERPIVIKNSITAVMGRPSENILALLE